MGSKEGRRVPEDASTREEKTEARQRIVERIEGEAGIPGLVDILAEKLSPTDLQSLLLEVYARRVRRRKPREILDDYRAGRFVCPSASLPQHLAVWDSLAWSMLPKDFVALELSPVAPLGTISALAPLSQDWSVTTSRNSEVVSDATNVLALEAAARRALQMEDPSKGDSRVHLAASHRLLRGQKFGEGPGVRQHFRLFALCSSGRDPGNLRFEVETALAHVEFFVRALHRYLGRSVSIRVAFADLGDPPHRHRLEDALVGVLAASGLPCQVGWEESTSEGKAYYRDLRFHIYAKHPNMGEKELVDGGGVDWGAKLLNNGKERMVISGLGSERLAQLFDQDIGLGQRV